jgi:transposase
MRQALLPDQEEVTLESLTTTASSGVLMMLRASRPEVACPSCGTLSRRVHSRYLRAIADLPWEGISVMIRLRTRRFFCADDGCPKRIFVEPLPQTVSRYGRRTCRSRQALDSIAMALGGAAGARLARQLGLLVHRSTLLRVLRQGRSLAVPVTPRVLGIDDWAWRKGRRYGTILCDLERGGVVDLLPDRERTTVEHWLRAHPGVEIVSRDRDSTYSQAVRQAAPQAIQVADRWHLLRSCSETLRRSLAHWDTVLQQVAQTSVRERQPARPVTIQPSLTVGPGPISPAKIEAKGRNRERRHERYLEVMERVHRGYSDNKIARELGLDRSTVLRWRLAGQFPERQDPPRSRQVDTFSVYLQQRWDEGCRNGTELWAELRQQGFTGGLDLVRIWIRRRYGLQSRRTHERRPRQRRASASQWLWLLLNEPARHRPLLADLYRQIPELAANAQAAREFFRIVRHRDIAAWPRWLEQARHTALAGFALSVQRDEAAVMAALRLPWSNGPVEGHVHRLKMLKRQMYGRAGFDLLRLRVLHAH